MNMKHLTLGLLALAQSTAMAAPLALKFTEVGTAQDVFKVSEPGKASFQNSYMYYSEWKEKQSGRFFPMEVSPVVAGIVAGGVRMPATEVIDASKWEDQAKEFAEVVNLRNKGGRPVLPPSPVPPAKRYTDDQANTAVVQTIVAAVLPRPLAQLKLNTENFTDIIENSDLDHYHFRIPGSFAVQALENDHIAAKTINPKQNYLLSVIDFRQYGCAAMKDGLRDYFKKEEGKKQLINESMYLISDLTMNDPNDLAAAEKLFGKRPNAILGQQVIFADRLIRGARTMFLFFAEGDKTRVVLLSNIAMQSKHFYGTKGILARQYILSGMTGGALGAATGAALAIKDKVGDLLAGANADVKNKNSCDRGLAKGLIRYSQDMFGEFAGAL